MGALECNLIIILIEINFKYPRIKESFHGGWLGSFSQAHRDSSEYLKTPIHLSAAPATLQACTHTAENTTVHLYRMFIRTMYTKDRVCFTNTHTLAPKGLRNELFLMCHFLSHSNRYCHYYANFFHSCTLVVHTSPTSSLVFVSCKHYH